MTNPHRSHQDVNLKAEITRSATLDDFFDTYGPIFALAIGGLLFAGIGFAIGLTLPSPSNAPPPPMGAPIIGAIMVGLFTGVLGVGVMAASGGVIGFVIGTMTGKMMNAMSVGVRMSLAGMLLVMPLCACLFSTIPTDIEATPPAPPPAVLMLIGSLWGGLCCGAPLGAFFGVMFWTMFNPRHPD